MVRRGSHHRYQGAVLVSDDADPDWKDSDLYKHICDLTIQDIHNIENDCYVSNVSQSCVYGSSEYIIVGSTKLYSHKCGNSFYIGNLQIPEFNHYQESPDTQLLVCSFMTKVLHWLQTPICCHWNV